ncbi:alpha-ketoglutarate-dependent dioxygenase AlkB [Halomonas sp. HP20-15]|uniref:alpha-ketoglutarate-dependent dioxygenase AlkB family protein n=1 Tax=Halomonas sp. HP20-15 TaxID=3085901 RepID=UPI002980E28C|nr:alpha-ketoglutarate-dependent dioxygenase AlkB [Halomonas sp. HP20-15]MDW5375589.1 alpha-ketoglutarate-dependent dioxygenase AlkB [Halomonas sp. HP20-15]
MLSTDASGWETLLSRPPLLLYRDCLTTERADALLACLERELRWQRPELTFYGRRHSIPRSQVWMGDPEASYRYSQQDFHPEPWHPAVRELRDRVQSLVAEHDPAAGFNSVLLNRYASGDERMGWHSDDEPELGDAPLVAAVSLGAERPLCFRHRHGPGQAFNVWLPHASLLVMGRGCQHALQHALLPRAIPGVRLSLTFRHIDAP